MAHLPAVCLGHGLSVFYGFQEEAVQNLSL